MRKATYCFLLTAIFFSGYSYGQDNCGDTAVINKLSGEWQWIKRVDGTIAGTKVSDPASCYCTRKIVIEKNCTIEYYKNDSLTNSSSYTIVRDKCPPTEQVTDILKINSIGDCITIDNDTLCLSHWIGMDASSANYYVRIKKQ